MRLQRQVTLKARVPQGGERLPDLAVALAGRYDVAGCHQRILDLDIFEVWPEQFVGVGVRPDAALHEIRCVECRPKCRRADTRDDVRAPFWPVAIDLLLVLVREDQPALFGKLRKGAHAVDHPRPVKLRGVPVRYEKREDPDEVRVQLARDVSDATEPRQLRLKRSIDVDLADR